jgi:hypothetical protein
MKKMLAGLITSRALVILSFLLLSSCTSITLIQTVPIGAKVYINEELKGETPYTLSDSKMFFESNSIRIEKSGYKPFQTVIPRSEEIDPVPAICGFFFLPAWLWAMKYKPVHLYELVPLEQ